MAGSDLKARREPMMAGALAAWIGAMGAVLPWADIGVSHLSGTEVDGAFTLAGSAAGGLLLVAWGRRWIGAWSLAVTGALGFAVLAIALYRGIDLSSSFDDLEAIPFASDPEVGIGLWATGLAGAVLFGSAVMGYRAHGR